MHWLSEQFDFVAKPSDAQSGGLEQIARELSVKSSGGDLGPPKLACSPPRRRYACAEVETNRRQADAFDRIGVQLAGPNALHYICSQLSGRVSGVFTDRATYARRIHRMFARRWTIARRSTLWRRARATFSHRDALYLSREPPFKSPAPSTGRHRGARGPGTVNGHRPSVDVCFTR